MKKKFKLFKFVSLLFLVVFCVVLFNFKTVNFITVNATGGSQGETWVIDEDAFLNGIGYFDVDFTSNNTEYGRLMAWLEEDDDYDIWHLTYYAAITGYATNVYSYECDSGLSSNIRNRSWRDEAYRTVTFETAPTGDLLTWLESNAVKETEETPDTTWQEFDTWHEFDIGGSEYEGIYSYGYLDDFDTVQCYNLLFRINEDFDYYNDYFMFLFIEYKGIVSSEFSYNRCYVDNSSSIITNQTNYSCIDTTYDDTTGYTWNNGGFVAEEGRGIEKRYFFEPIINGEFDPNESLFNSENGDTLIIHFDDQEINQNEDFGYEEIGVYLVICNDYNLNWTDFQVIVNDYVIGHLAVAYDTGYQEGIVVGEGVYALAYNEGYNNGILEGQNNSYNERYWLGYRNAIFNIWERGFDRIKNLTLDQIIEYANGYESLSPSNDIEGKDINFYTSKDYFTYNDWVLTQVYENGISTVPKSDNTYYDNTESFDYRSGYGQAWGLGYDLGYSEGSGRPLTPEEESIVYNWGYNAGYKAGQEDHSVGGLLKQAFGGVGELLDFELLPNLTLGGIVIVPLLLGIVFFILKRS